MALEFLPVFQAPLSGVGYPVVLTLDTSELSLAAVADTATLTPTLTDIDGTVQTAVYAFIWTSSDETIVTVDGSGLVTAIAAGSVTVQCAYPASFNVVDGANTTPSGFIFAQAQVSVDGIALNPTSIIFASQIWPGRVDSGCWIQGSNR